MTDIEVKYYKKKRDGVVAFQMPGNGITPVSVTLNESGEYDPAYHNSIISNAVGHCYPGDYMMYLSNGLWMAVKKEEFENAFEPSDVKIKKIANNGYVVEDEIEVSVEALLADTPVVEEPVAQVEEPVVEEALVEEVKEEKAESPKKKKKNFRE